ncbi:MAG TPA: M3 family metallopeptidase [Paucimonas sp.]|nr:M3 family metallopeptidase [Paucimonas sp.]
MRHAYFLKPLGAALLALGFAQAGAQAADRPTIPLLKAEEIKPFCDKGLDGLKKQVATMEQVKPGAVPAKKLFAEWNDLQIALEDLQGPIDVLNNMSPDAAVRSNAETCLVEASKFGTDLYQSEKLYARFKAAKPGDAIETKLRKDVLDGFEDTGVSLPADKKKRMKEILTRIEELSQAFARNKRDNTEKQTFTPEEVKGLPQAYLDKAKRDDKGNYLLGYSYPEYYPFMEYADNADARRRYMIGFANQGTAKNPPILKEAMDLRLEMAKLFDLPSYAHYVIRRRMAQTPEAVNKFLAEVQGVVATLEKKEIEELRAFKAETLKQPLAETRLERWDLSYWQRKLKQARYNLDQNELRKYFPTDAAVAWALHVSGQLYGVEFKRAEVPVWHADVQYYDVFDSKTKQRIAGAYLDLFPREGKYGHAAAWPARGSSTLAKRTPFSVLVTNFDRVGLNGDELETLVHEFGHVLHGVLSNTRYVAQSGTSVERDFVEAPSQMYEEWARRKESLALLSSFCKTACPTVDDALLQRMTAAHNFGRGIRYARQLLYASYDMNLHNEKSGEPLAIWQKMEGATPLGHVPGTEFPGQFGHYMGGYAAGYYGYMWSEVLALDMLSRYNGKLMNPETGRWYRKTILSRGSETRGGELVKTFLGRAPNNKAFFDEIMGKRLH